MAQTTGSALLSLLSSPAWASVICWTAAGDGFRCDSLAALDINGGVDALHCRSISELQRWLRAVGFKKKQVDITDVYLHATLNRDDPSTYSCLELSKREEPGDVSDASELTEMSAPTSALGLAYGSPASAPLRQAAPSVSAATSALGLAYGSPASAPWRQAAPSVRSLLQQPRGTAAMPPPPCLIIPKRGVVLAHGIAGAGLNIAFDAAASTSIFVGAPHANDATLFQLQQQCYDSQQQLLAGGAAGAAGGAAGAAAGGAAQGSAPYLPVPPPPLPVFLG